MVSRKTYEFRRNVGPSFASEAPYVWGIVVKALAGLAVLSFRCLLDFLINSLDQPSLVSYREFVVIAPVRHPEVVTQEKKRLKDKSLPILQR
jgi:hypothetical protein